MLGSIIHFAVCYGLLQGTIATALPPTSQPQSQCKPVPGSANWPAKAQWRTLNSTVSGRLKAPYAPGAVCHPKLSAFNNASCSALVIAWTNSSWQESNAWTSMYNDDTCVPITDSPCSTAGYPAYVIEAETVADVQAGIKFAYQTGVRLIVKGTGHDAPGHSAGAGSLSIWTHLLRGINVTRHASLAAKHDAVASVKLGAGMVWGDIYTEMAKANLTVIGGADPHVGVGGWTQGSGHGPISSYYGLGADQVLEMEVITADGEHRIINSASYSDLFWAMRGGGPSTYAVMLPMTVKAYPQLQGVQYVYKYNFTGSSDAFWNFVAVFSSRLPRLSEQGGMGYYYLVPNSGPSNDGGVVEGSFLFPNKSQVAAQTLTQSLERALSESCRATGSINFGSEYFNFSSFMRFWSSTNGPESVGKDTRYGSWLMDGPALTHNTTKLRDTLRATGPWIWIGHLVAGPGVRNAKPVGGSDAVLPAWRKAYVHLRRSHPQGTYVYKLIIFFSYDPDVDSPEQHGKGT